MTGKVAEEASLREENQQLRERLAYLEDALQAIRSGEVDALVVAGPNGDHIFTLTGALEPYRVMVEAMSEGAVTLAADGTVLYSNDCFARIVRTPQTNFLGVPLRVMVAPWDRERWDNLLARGLNGTTRAELTLQAAEGTLVPVMISMSPLPESVISGIAVVITDLTAAAAAAAAKSRLALVVESSNDAIISTTLEGVVQSWNPAAEDLFGYPATEAIGKPVTELIVPPERAGEPVRFLEAVRKGQSIHQVETVRLHKDGTPVDISISVSPMRDSVAAITGASMIFSDITERKRAEDKLKESEAFKSVILNSVDAEIVVLDRAGKILAVNELWRSFALENGKIPGQTVSSAEIGANYFAACQGCVDASHSNDLDGSAAKQGIEAVLAGTIPTFSLEYPCHSPDQLRWFKMAVVPYGYAETAGVVITHTNITERMRLQLDREQELERMQKIAGRVPGLIYQYRLRPDGSSCFPYASEAIRTIYQVTPDEVREDASAVFAKIHPEDCAGVLASIQESAATLRPWQHEYRVKLPNQGIRWVSGNSIPQREDDGSVLWYGFISDITERKQIEDELFQHRNHLEVMVDERTEALSIAKEAAEAASRAKSIFLATMSHELRTPLNAIMGMTELALRRATDPRQSEQLNKVKNSSNNLLAIIKDILDITRIEADRLILHDAEFRIHDVMDNLSTSLNPKAAEKHLDLIIDVAAELYDQPLRGDDLRLGQVLLNLAGNAIKFTAQGWIMVRARLIEENADKALVRFEVEDTGIGIAESDQQRIFNIFEQADGSSSRKYGGTGLGLAICKRLVQLMGGDIHVESQIAHGSTFWFVIPFTKAGHPAPPAPPEVVVTTSEQLKARHAGAYILVADDDPTNQEIAQDLLEEAGLVVHIAEDGHKAVAMARRINYDLILMDVQMPDMDGMEATRLIRQSSNNPKVPIIALTANVFPEYEARCRDAGMNGFISRPVESEDLLATALNYLAHPVD
jgi:PAS domain S-box-containing protein